MYMQVLDLLSNENGHQTCKNWRDYFAELFYFGGKIKEKQHFKKQSAQCDKLQ